MDQKGTTGIERSCENGGLSFQSREGGGAAPLGARA